MHGAMRRMPAEQARHAKRLGHVQVGYRPIIILSSGSSTTATTTTQQSVTSVTTTTSTAVSTTTSHTSASTSTIRSSESSAPSASSSPSSPSSTPSFTPASTPTTDAASPTTSISISPSSSAPPQSGAAASGLSTGALAGIIAGGIIVGVALIVFFIRKTYLRRRERKRISWTGAPGLRTGSLDERKRFPDANERSAPPTGASTPRNVPMSPFEPRGQSGYSAPGSPGVAPTTFPTYSVPTPLSATYNNPPVVAYPNLPAPPAPSMYGLAMPRASSGLGASSVHPHHAPMPAIVRCSFVPSLPDELSITTGERVFVIEQYDDGWNLCANGRGERGMVPRECLDATPPDQIDIGWRNSKRMSSLNSDGRRY